MTPTKLQLVLGAIKFTIAFIYVGYLFIQQMNSSVVKTCHNFHCFVCFTLLIAKSKLKVQQFFFALEVGRPILALDMN